MKQLPVRLADREDAAHLAELPAELRLAMTDIASSARDGLLAMSVTVGLRVMGELLDAELAAKVGAKGRHDPDRTASRHGTAPGSVVLGGRRVPVNRPRARTRDGQEVQLDTYTAFAADDLLGQVVMERMLQGLATRRYRPGRRAGRRRCGGRGTRDLQVGGQPSVCARTSKALEELLGRDLTGLRVAALMVDGVCIAEHCCVVALAILADGAKLPVGLWLGSTENTTVVTQLLADLVDRGLDASKGLLVVLDGAKALDRAVRKVFGTHALVQRCAIHKRRNVTDHLPEAERGRLDARLAQAFANPDPDAGLRAARELARALQDRHPGAAASLREGLEEMFTVRRLGVPDRLARTLDSTNPAASMISIARTTCRNARALEGRPDGVPLDRGRDAGCRAQLPAGQGLQGHARAGGRAGRSRRGGDRRTVCVGSAGAVTEDQQDSGHPRIYEYVPYGTRIYH